MPFKSKAQKGWMFANHPKMAERWAHHTKDISALPERVGSKEKQSMDQIAVLARQAAESRYVEKLAADTEVTPSLIRHFAGQVKLSPLAFCKLAYANPDQYVTFLKLATGVKLTPQQVKHAAGANKLVELLLKAKGAVGQGASAAGGMASKGLAAASPIAKSTPGKIGAGVLGAGGIGAGAYSLLGSGGAPAGPTEQAANLGSQMSQPAAAPKAMPQAPSGSAQGPSAGSGGGVDPKLLALGGGAAALGLGGYALARRRKQEKMSRDELVRDVVRRVLVKRAAATIKTGAAKILSAHLNEVAALMPLEKSAAVRQLQKAVAEGKPLSQAIKLAFPLLSGEQRGIMAVKLTKAATEWFTRKTANVNCGPSSGAMPTQTMQTFNGPAAQGMDQLSKMAEVDPMATGIGAGGGGLLGGMAGKGVGNFMANSGQSMLRQGMRSNAGSMMRAGRARVNGAGKWAPILALLGAGLGGGIGASAGGKPSIQPTPPGMVGKGFGGAAGALQQQP